MSSVGPAIIAFVLVFISTAGAALLIHTRARGRESRIIERAGIRDATETGNRKAALIRPSRANDSNPVQRVLDRIHADDRLGKLCEQAGLRPDPSGVLRSCGIAAVAGAVGAVLLLPRSLVLLALPVVLGGGAGIPLWRLRRKIQSRLDRFESQFPDGLEFIARSMRAGHAFSVSLEMLFREFEDPMAGEFRRTFEEQNLGLPLEIALAKFAERVPLVDVRFFTSAVLLQRKTGGNLTEILDNLAHLIRERYKLRGKVRAISAHGRMTGNALTAIPVFVGGLMLWMNHDYASFFFGTTLGREMLGGSAALQVIGYLVISRIVKIEV